MKEVREGAFWVSRSRTFKAGDRKCKGPEVGTNFVSLRSSEEAGYGWREVSEKELLGR